MTETKPEIATIVLEVPAGLLQKFGETPGIRARLALEALAIECYRKNLLTDIQCGRLLGMTQLEFDDWRAERGIPWNLPVEYFLRNYRTVRKLLSKK